MKTQQPSSITPDVVAGHGEWWWGPVHGLSGIGSTVASLFVADGLLTRAVICVLLAVLSTSASMITKWVVEKLRTKKHN